MSNINTGGPAFPTATLAQKTEGGMTLRDYFASKAMQSLIVAYKDDHSVSDEISKRAYYYADAMLKEREA